MTDREILELRQSRMKLVRDARAIAAKADTENRAMNSEETEQYERLWTEQEAAGETIKTQERARSSAALEAELNEPEHRHEQRPALGNEDGTGLRSRAYGDAFTQYLRGGVNVMNAEQRATLQVDSDTGGGFIAASERLIAGIWAAADNLIPFGSLITKYPCSYGETLGAVSRDGDVSDFEFGAGELTAADEDTGLSFGLRELRAKAMKRKLIKVSRALLASPRINAEQVVMERVAMALARTLDNKYLNGNGAEEPLGLFNTGALSSARDSSTDNTTAAVTADGLLNAQELLHPSYRAKAQWLWHRDTKKMIRKLKLTGTGTVDYLWQPGLKVGEPDTILGSPYILDDYVPHTYTTRLYVGAYGDFSYYAAAEAMSASVQRLVEKYAETGQVGLLFSGMAADGQPILADAFVRVKLA